jgi:molybdopterin converting factor small subunit
MGVPDIMFKASIKIHIASFPYFSRMKSVIEILAFGQLTDITGRETLQIENVQDIDELHAKLINLFPDLADSKFLIAVNKEIMRGNVKLNAGDVVALLPPFSGG